MSDNGKLTDKEKWINDIKWVISTPQGRRFYWGVMARCKAFTEKFVADPYLCYFQKGQRSVGISMLEDLMEAKPESYLQMQQEQNSRKTREGLKSKREIKNKKSYSIDSPSLPNTERGKSKGE